MNARKRGVRPIHSFPIAIHVGHMKKILTGIVLMTVVGLLIIKTFFVSYNRIFVMGDNRFEARDSRYFGPIPFSSIIGRKL